MTQRFTICLSREPERSVPHRIGSHEQGNQPGSVVGMWLLIFTASVCVYFAANKFGAEETADEQRIPLPAGPRRFP